MRRAALLMTLAAVVATALPSSAGGAVLDGKKVRSVAFKFSATGPQQHVLAETAENDVDPGVTNKCAPPECFAVPFTLRPAKGVSPKTPVSARITWTLPTSRFWLMIVDVTKKTPVIKAECYSFYVTAGTAATVVAKNLSAGKKYEVWATAQQVIAPDTITGSIAYPATHKVAANPGPFPTELFVNGCNS
jgi:hypothetical protein